MSVQEQLSRARHEEPLRTTVRDRRVWASRRWSPRVSRRDADIDRVPGWFTQALWCRVRSRHPCVPTGAQPDAFAFSPTSAPPASGWLLAGKRAAGELPGPYDVTPPAGSAWHAGLSAHAVALRPAPNGSLAGPVITGEQERRRLCRELHDGLGPTLAGLALGLGTAQALSGGQPNLYELLGRLAAETQRAVTDLRRVVYGLRPSALDELGLAEALRDQAERFRCQAPTLAISLDAPINGLAGLPPVVEMACYRIVTEALANVARHAHATRCAVRIHSDHGIHVDVRDNGAGLPAHWRAGVGIASMRERVSELGGELVIEPSRPHGTRVAARLPVREQP
jgi:histidine kinase/histidine kinase/DNA gyrase B/HSP90-like ATPase